MRALKPFLLGTLASGVAVYACVAALAVAAQVGGRSLHLAVGPLVLVSVARNSSSTTTTLGAGLVLLALAGGVANLLAALALGHRAGGAGDRVD